MPARNAESYLDACILSIINQTYRNWELVIVNDHSEDSTSKILKKWSLQDGRIFYLENKGQGIIPALNLALSKSSGVYITRMDADDIMHPEKLEYLSAKLCSNNRSSIVVGKVKYFAEEDLGEGYENYAKWLNALIDNESHWEEIYRECVIPSPCWMMRKKDLLKMGGFSSAIYPEDYDMCFRLYISDAVIVVVDKVLHYWRDHPERSSRNMEVYQNPWFLDIKLKYFIGHELKYKRDVLVWGAGRKGKIIVKSLLEHKKNVVWVSNNIRKQGKNIYGIKLISPSEMVQSRDMKMIIAIGNKEDKAEIESYLNSLGFKKSRNYFMFS